jgi:hypothetical protein
MIKNKKPFLGNFENFKENIFEKEKPAEEKKKEKEAVSVGEQLTLLTQKFLKSKGLLEDHVVVDGNKKKIDIILSRTQDKVSIKFKMNKLGKIVGYSFENFNNEGMILDNVISYFEVLTVLYEDLNGNRKFAKSIEDLK